MARGWKLGSGAATRRCCEACCYVRAQVCILFEPFAHENSSCARPLPREPVAVDAIPDIGENQQIVFSEWPGRSPRDVEDQVTYPLTSALLGIPGVRTVRSSSALGFSSIYVIFEDDVDFWWSRSRVLERLASLPPERLPHLEQPHGRPGVQR